MKTEQLIHKTTLVAIGLLLGFLLGCGERSYEVQIPASTVWVSTGIEISEGSTVLIEAIGSISPNGKIYTDADGSTNANWIRDFNVYPEINHCALIARIGAGGRVHQIGVSREIKASEEGVLLLGINDKHPVNNVGVLDVTIRIQR